MKAPAGILIPFFVIVFSSTFALGQKGPAKQLDPNPWMNTTWKVNDVPFESKDNEVYFFTAADPLDFDNHWGHTITFGRETFSSSYSAMCGNDCFTSVTGEFYFTEANKVHIRVLNIERNGFCNKKSQTLNQDYGFYDVIQIENGWEIRKVN